MTSQGHVNYTLIRGKLIHSISSQQIQIIKDALVELNDCGEIIHIFEKVSQEHQSKVQNFKEKNKFLQLKEQQFIIPGFIDTHIHAPQYSYTGTATDKPLMEWLDHYTFPAEQAFEDPDHAYKVYTHLIKRTLSEGTTTAVYFATIHLPASKTLADLMEKLGQRGFVGMVQMDQNAPQNYIADTATNLQHAKKLIEYIQGKKSSIVMPILTPRFIPTCSVELMHGLGQIAKEYDVHVQSHISESNDEIAFVESLHPGRRDAEIFDEVGLLRQKSIMAHAVHVNDLDVQLLLERGTSIAHCPLSNFYFANGVLPAGKLLNQGVKVGLGTDVAGGYSVSMLNAIRYAVVASKTLEIYQKSVGMEEQVNYKKAFWMATLGGAKALSLDSKIGSFEVGKSFDALLIDFQDNIDVFESDSGEDLFQKFVNLGDSRNIIMTWVQGKVVSQKLV